MLNILHCISVEIGIYWECNTVPRNISCDFMPQYLHIANMGMSKLQNYKYIYKRKYQTPKAPNLTAGYELYLKIAVYLRWGDTCCTMRGHLLWMRGHLLWRMRGHLQWMRGHLLWMRGHLQWMRGHLPCGTLLLCLSVPLSEVYRIYGLCYYKVVLYHCDVIKYLTIYTCTFAYMKMQYASITP